MAEGRRVDLLDANLLIALVVDDHVHHEPAERWSMARAAPFATCPITQGALVRFLVREGASGTEAGGFLGELLADSRHRFWLDDLGYDGVDLRPVVGHRQVTDAYLLTLAIRSGTRLITFDGGIGQLLATPAERQRHLRVLE